MAAGVKSKPIHPLPARERAEAVLSQLDQLPILPAVAARLLSLTTSDDSSARDVVELIESDAAMTAAILRLVRRADMGVRGGGITVARAVTLLGFNAVRRVALTVQLYETLSGSDVNKRVTETRKGIWLHSVATACTAEMIAQQIGGAALAGDAFVCGLLHDVGKVALDVCLPKSYARVVELVERRSDCICDVEHEVLGLDHTVAGKRLVTRWQLPQPVVECVWLHHQTPDAMPSSVGFARLVNIVHLADNLVRRERIGYSGYQHIGDVDGLAGSLGVDAARLPGILERLPEKLEPFHELLGLDDRTSRKEHAASLETANRQLAKLNAGLSEANRRLEIRSKCLAALERFSGRLTERDRIGDVCVAAAESVRMMFDAQCALAFVVGPSSRGLHVGTSDESRKDQTSSIWDASESEPGRELALVARGLPSHGVVAAPASCEAIWHGRIGSAPQEPLWILPLAAGEPATGAVLVAAAEDVVRGFQSASSECRALSRAMGLAASFAAVRIESERTSEELLDLNRRVRDAQQELVRTRSISMIGEMAGGAAHELNNPLSVMSGRAQMELGKCEDAETARTFQIIIEQTQRATQIVTDLMHFAKPEAPTPVLLPLAGVLEPLCQHWRTSSGLRDEQLTLALADNRATVYADGNQLREMIDAVLANAVEATDPETARLQVNSRSRASDETVRIVVKDNGVGMTREVLEHALDPFFSHRPAGRGRGLGLSRAYRLAEIHGGHLWLESTPNVGTTVTLELPARAPFS